MNDCATAAVRPPVTPTRVKLPAPLVSTTSPALRVVLTRTGPATPAAPVWMCAMFTTVVDGKFDMLTWKFIDCAVMVPLASRVMFRSIVATPVPVCSALVIGGVSFAGDSVAVNRVVVVPLVVVEGELLDDEQPAARRRPRTAIDRCFICCATPFESEKLTREVEAHDQRLRHTARGGLRERGLLAVREIQLEDVRAGALLDGESVLRRALREPCDTRRHFGRDVDRRPDAHAAAQPDEERVVLDAGDLREERRDVVYPHRHRV